MRLLINKMLRWLGSDYFIGRMVHVPEQPFVFDEEDTHPSSQG